MVTPDGVRKLPGKTCDILKIDFKTMTRLKAEAFSLEKPEFSRIGQGSFPASFASSIFYCGERMSIDFNAH